MTRLVACQTRRATLGRLDSSRYVTTKSQVLFQKLKVASPDIGKLAIVDGISDFPHHREIVEGIINAKVEQFGLEVQVTA